MEIKIEVPQNSIFNRVFLKGRNISTITSINSSMESWNELPSFEIMTKMLYGFEVHPLEVNDIKIFLNGNEEEYYNSTECYFHNSIWNIAIIYSIIGNMEFIFLLEI